MNDLETSYLEFVLKFKLIKVKKCTESRSLLINKVGPEMLQEKYSEIRVGRNKLWSDPFSQTMWAELLQKCYTF